MQRVFRPGLMSSIAVLVGLLLIYGGNAMAYEEPGYSEVSRLGAIEFRRYEPYLIAETVVENASNFDAAGNEGFRRLFAYISGANTQQSKIAMTTPVSQEPQSEKIAMTVPVQQADSVAGWRIAFTLPRQYTFDTAPVPTDDRVQIVAVPGRLVAVLRYSGRWTERNFLRHRDELIAALASEDIRQSGEPWLARYNAPFSLPFMRRNEVLIEVEAVSVP